MWHLGLVVFIVVNALVFAAAGIYSQPKSAVSASVKDTSVNGVEGVNLVWNAPFKIDDYVVGFKYSIAKFGQAPDVVYIARDHFVKGQKISLLYSLDIAASKLACQAKWTTTKGILALTGNNVDLLTSISGSSSVVMIDKKIGLDIDYSVQSQVASIKATSNIKGAVVSVKVDTANIDPAIVLKKAISKTDTIIPSYSINSGSMKLAWLRKWTGGSLETTLYPDDKVVLEWKDEGCHGVWTTTAKVPLRDRRKTKITFARDWTY